MSPYASLTMVCVRPALANGLVFNGSGELSLNTIGLTPDPVGACGYADGPILKLLFCNDDSEADTPTLFKGADATGIVPVFVNAAEVLMLLYKVLLKFVAAVVSAVASSADGDCAFCLVS